MRPLSKSCGEYGHRPSGGHCADCGIVTTGILRATRIYPNGRNATTYWMPEHIDEWSEYNKKFRPGCAQVVQGKLRYDSGAVDKAKIAAEIGLHKKHGYG